VDRTIATRTTGSKGDGGKRCTSTVRSLPLASATAKQRFNTALCFLQPLASAVADLPPRKFESAMQWLDSVYQQFISGEWELTVIT